jgi:poly-gamma-glutamate biosynthesis protein PgsC/CapC
MVELAVTLGIIFSLFFIEVFGMAAGGIVIPGYIALQLNNPDRLLGTLVISIITFFIIKLIGKYTFLFGRRQMVVAVMIGTILSIISHRILFYNTGTGTLELSAVGWIVPGLIAHWSIKQGYLKTIFMLCVTAILVRLIVIISFNGMPFPELY